MYLRLVVVVGQCGTHNVDPLAPKCSNQVLCSDMAPLGGGGGMRPGGACGRDSVSSRDSNTDGRQVCAGDALGREGERTHRAVSLSTPPHSLR